MLSNAPFDGLDLLGLMASKAAERASAQLTGAIRLAKCESVECVEGCLSDDVDVESYAVAADRQTVVIAVFATAPQRGEGRKHAGAGRFTFTLTSNSGGARAPLIS